MPKILQKTISLLLCSTILFLICGCSKDIPAATTGNDPEITVPIIMYHGLTESQKLRNKYMIPPNLFENDLSYLREHGYTTIFVRDLIDHFKSGKKLPDKPILLTFDDGYYNNYVYAFPLLKKYKCKALISPIGISADEAENEKYRSPLWSQCKWCELKEMYSSGLVEIGNHTYNLHKTTSGRMGAAKSSGESEQDYSIRLKEDLITANNRISQEIGRKPYVFVYPFGAKSSSTEDIVKSMNFESIMDCENKLNVLTSKDDLFHLHRFLRPDDLSSKEFFENKAGI